MPFEGRPDLRDSCCRANARWLLSAEAGGHYCLITPAYENGALVDLVATHCRSLNSRTRRGVANMLGADWLAVARANVEAVHVFAHPVEWLQRGCAGVVILDWRRAPPDMLDVPGAACSTIELASRLDDAFRCYTPRLFVANRRQPEGVRHAA
jgi:hypothetical protein